MAEIIQPRRRWEEVEYDLTYVHRESGQIWFGFPCDKQGRVLVHKLAGLAYENYEACVKGSNGMKRGAVREYRWERTLAAVLRCDCGTHVELHDPLTNTCRTCGREFNMSGQLLAPRSQWEDRFDEDDAHPYNYQYGYVKGDE